MLILKRRQDESLVIAGLAEVMVIRAESGRASLGVNAPRAVPVVRKEIYERTPSSNTLCHVLVRCWDGQAHSYFTTHAGAMALEGLCDKETHQVIITERLA